MSHNNAPLPLRWISLAILGIGCFAGSATADVAFPNQAYVLPTTVTVRIYSGSFGETDGIGGVFGDHSDVYGVVSLAGNADQHTPTVDDDADPVWDPPFVATFYYDIATYGYSTPLKLDFWDEDSGFAGSDDHLEDRTIDISLSGDFFPEDNNGYEIDYTEHYPWEDDGASGTFITHIVASVDVDWLRVHLDSGESWNTGADQLKLGSIRILSHWDYCTFGQVTINNGGVLTAPGGVLIGARGFVNINNGGLLTTSGSVLIHDRAVLGLNYGGRLRVNDLVAQPGTFHWNSGTLEFTEGLSVSNTNPFNLDDLAITVGRTLQVDGELEIVSGGVLVVDNGILDTRSNVTIDGGYLSANPSESGQVGRFDVAAGKTFTFRNAGVGSFEGDSKYSFDTTLKIESGSDVTYEGGLELGSATLLIDGQDSKLTTGHATPTAQYWGTGGSAANATFSNRAQGELKGDLFLGVSGLAGTSGTLRIESDADVTVNNLFVGALGDQGTGVLTVTGAGSTLIQNYGKLQLTVGGAGASSGAVLVNDGGLLKTGASTTFINPTGSVTVDGGTLTARGHVRVDGGSLNVESGSFNPAAEKYVTFVNNGQGSLAGHLDLSADQTLEVFSGSDLALSGAIFLGRSGDGTLIVDGAGSSFSAATPMTLGIHGGVANATFSDSAEGHLNGDLKLAVSGVPGTMANLAVESWAVVSARSINLATHTQGTATLTVTGVGSELLQSGTASLAIGGTGTSSGTVDVTDGGMVQTGTGPTTINPTGIVTVAGGAFDALGDINLEGGVLTVTHSESQLYAKTIHLNSGSFSFSHGRLGVERFEGDLTNNAGKLSPGRPEPEQSIGLTTITGNLTDINGTLAIELGGTQRGAEYDAITVDGDVDLSAFLDVSLIDGFELRPGQAFEILQVGGAFGGGIRGLPEMGLVGTFGDVPLWITFAGGDGNDIALVTSTPLTGDYDGDGLVNSADYDAWRASYGSTITPGYGADGNGDGVVDAADFTVWRDLVGGAPVPAALRPVPEPSAAGLAWGIACTLAGTRRRRSRLRESDSRGSGLVAPSDHLIMVRLDEETGCGY